MINSHLHYWNEFLYGKLCSQLRMKGFNELVQTSKTISNQWVPFNTVHDTGIGKTLEDYLGIRENNFPDPNGEKVELKSMRKNSNSMIL